MRSLLTNVLRFSTGLRRPGLGLLVAFLSLICTTAVAQQAGLPEKRQRAWVTILATTDLHGNILPIDYYTNRPDARGLARAATIVKSVRRENPDALLIDSGDTIQGTPLASYHNKRNNGPPDPVMLAMNAMKYDAMAVGNHEYNFGPKVLAKARSEASFPWLSANTYRKGTDQTFFKPYIIKEVSGVRVGVIGLTTPGVPAWENAENYSGLEFRDPLEEARKWVNVVRQMGRADLVVIAMHMGLERDLRTGGTNPGQVQNENMALAIAERVPGIDLILMGHTHREVPSLYVANNDFSMPRAAITSGSDGVQTPPPGGGHGVLLAQANNWARSVARVDIYLERTDGSEASAPRWRVRMKQSRTIPVTEQTEADPEIVKLAEPYDRETQAWLGQAVGESAADLSAAEARFRDTAILDLIHRVQLEAGRADVSMAASFNPQARIPRGHVTVRDIAALYEYENTLVVLEVTGRQLKDALEHSARYFKAYAPGLGPAELVDEKVPGYNFDIAEGVDYELDISKPAGQRILNLRFRGRPVSPEQKFRLATNNYRVSGGGGYTMYRGAPVLYRSSEEIRELIINWVERHKTVPAEPTNNWRLLPVK